MDPNKGKRVYIYKTTQDADEWRSNFLDNTGLAAVDSKVHLYLTQPISFQEINSYTTPFAPIVEGALGGSVGSLLKVGLELKSAAEGKAVVINPWFKNAKAWTNPEPIKFSIKFDFQMGMAGLWDGRSEVLNPILQLAFLALPSSITDINMKGPSAGVSEMAFIFMDKVFKGLSSSEGIAENMASITKSLTSTLETSAPWNIAFGPLVIHNALFTSATPTFSEETDDKGAPISGSIQMEFEAIKPLSSGASNEFLRSVKV